MKNLIISIIFFLLIAGVFAYLADILWFAFIALITIIVYLLVI